MIFAGAGAGLGHAGVTILAGESPIVPLVPAVGAGLAGVVVLRLRHRVPDVAYIWGSLLGAVLLTLSTRTQGVQGELATDNIVFYLWPVLYLAAFLPWRAMLVQAAAASLLYGALLAEALPLPVAVVRITLATVTFFGCGALVGVMRDRLVALIADSEERSLRDDLTGLLNRRGLAAGVQRLANGPADEISVLIGDLDHFKLLNDGQGHDAGDTALERIAVIISELVGGAGLAARQGGEEFVIVLEAPLHEAYRLAERIRIAVREHVDGADGAQTISFGLAAGPPQEEVLSVLLRQADMALYRAKVGGRDQTVVAEPGAEALAGVRDSLDPRGGSGTSR